MWPLQSQSPTTAPHSTPRGSRSNYPCRLRERGCIVFKRNRSKFLFDDIPWPSSHHCHICQRLSQRREGAINETHYSKQKNTPSAWHTLPPNFPASISIVTDPNNRTVCNAAGVASSSKVLYFLLLFFILRLSGQSSSFLALVFAPFLK